MPQPTNLDHIVIAAQTLEQGITWFKNITNIDIPKGGHHPLMGTHNHLMQIGQNAFLEIIAIDPNVDVPDRPRWYALDDPTLQHSLQIPRLITWVVNTTDLSSLLSQTDFHYGEALHVTRGDLSWQLTVPKDGALPNHGLLPSLIEWHAPGNPCPKMPDLGCQLKQITIHHPYPDWYAKQITAINSEHLVTIKPAPKNQSGYFEIEFTTDKKNVTLSSKI